MNQRYKLTFQRNWIDEKTISQRVKLKTDSIFCQDAPLKKTKIKYFVSRVDFRSPLYSCNKCELMKIHAKSDTSKLKQISYFEYHMPLSNFWMVFFSLFLEDFEIYNLILIHVNYWNLKFFKIFKWIFLLCPWMEIIFSLPKLLW